MNEYTSTRPSEAKKKEQQLSRGLLSATRAHRQWLRGKREVDTLPVCWHRGQLIGGGTGGDDGGRSSLLALHFSRASSEGARAAVLEDHRLWGCTRRVDCRPAGEGEGEECHETGAASRTVRPGLRWQVRQWHLHPLITAFDSSVLLSWMNSETSNRIVGNLAIIYPSFNYPQCEMHKSGHGILVNKHELLLKWKNNMQRKWESQISSAEIYYYNNRIKVLKFGAWWLKAFLAGV